MSRKRNLSQALGQFDTHPVTPETAALKQDALARTTTPIATDNDNRAPVQRTIKSELPPSRQGKKALTGYFDPEVLKQLKIMAATEETTIQALMTEALNDLFKKYRKPHIA